MRRRPGLRCPVAERTWAALGFAFPGVALPNAPTTAPIHGPMGRHDDDDLPKLEACGNISAKLNRRSPTSSRRTVLYSVHYTLLFFTPPHVALISARLDRGISAARSVSLASHSTAGSP